MRKASHNLSQEWLVTQTGSSELLIRVVVNPDHWKWSLNLLRCSEWEPSPTRAINKDSVTWILGSRAHTRLEWHHVGPWTKPGWTDHLISTQPRYPGYPGCAPGAAWYLGTRGTVCTWGTRGTVHGYTGYTRNIAGNVPRGWSTYEQHSKLAIWKTTPDLVFQIS